MNVFKIFGCLALVLSVSACAGPSPAPKEIYGAWKGSGGAELDFLPNGKLLLKNVPEDYILVNESKKLVSGQGKWSLMDPPGQSALVYGVNWWDIGISIDSFEDSPGGAGMFIQYNNSEKPDSIFFWKDEPGGERFEFYRH